MKKSIFLISCFLLMILAGCSGGQSSNMMVPEISPIGLNDGNLQIGVSEYFSDGSPAGGVGVLGLYNVSVNLTEMSGEITPSRTTSLTDVLEVIDITNFLRLSPCTDCAELVSIKLNEHDQLVLSIGIKHPFPIGDPLMPISGRNRADLHVFNVEGIVVSDGSETMAFGGLGEVVGNVNLVNASGYTPYLDGVLDGIFQTDATIHPYILHFDNYSQGNFDPESPTGFTNVINPGPQGYLVMRMGSRQDVKEYIFDIDGDESFSFIFAVGCTYAVSTENRFQRFEPEYRMPQHNKKAASEVYVEVVSNDMISEIEDSEATLHIKVLDINHGVPVGDALDEMLADSSVGAITVDIPGVTLAPVILSSPTEISGYGNDPSDPLTFEVVVTNSGQAIDGFYKGLVKVTDTYPVGLNTSPLLNEMDGIERVDPIVNPLEGLFEIGEFATYQTFEVEVAPANPDCFIVSYPDPPEIIQGETIILDGTTSVGHAPIISYEWDLHYDGVDFEADEVGEIIEIDQCTVETFTVALRVTDERMMYSICTVDVTIDFDDSLIEGWGDDILCSDTLTAVESNVMGFRSIGVWEDDIYIAVWDYFGSLNNARQIWLLRSGDKGETWDPEINITNYTDGFTRDPSLWVDRNNGDIYSAWYSTAGGGSYSVRVSRSTDRGDTWEPDVKVNPGGGTQQWQSLAIDDSVDPAYLYVSYSLNNSNLYVASTTTDNFSTWNNVRVDDNDSGALQSSVIVSGYDSTLWVTWGDSTYYGGTGSVRVDKSTDNGQTFGDDTTIYSNPSETHGPYNPVIAVNPTTGAPGVLWRSTLSSGWEHRFIKATDDTGEIWGDSILIDQAPSFYLWAGALDVSADGHWVICTHHEVQYRRGRAWFTQSQDDGVTWEPNINVSNADGVFNPNMVMDECKDVYVFWTDIRAGQPSYVYFNKGS